MSTKKTKKNNMPLIVTGVYKNIPLTIYGEIHNDIDNSFYTQLNLPEEAIVMVEHSTEYCVLQPGEEVLFESAKGSEWIWFTRTVNNQPVMCIDSRIADGFLNKLEEDALRFGQVSIDAIILKTKQIIKAMIKIKQKFLPIESEYTQIMIETRDLFKQVITNFANDVVDDAVIKQLIDNLLFLSSLSMDMNIIDKLDQHASTVGEKKEIHLFVGAAHAIRLHTILSLEKFSGNTSLLKLFGGGQKRTRRQKR